ncbi:MAG: ZIP family metal transporter [Verrucomicrobiota bacterium]
MTGFDVLSIVLILGMTLGCGSLPVFFGKTAAGRFQLGSAFAAGVFLALSLLIMLPNGMGLFQKSLPNLNYPLASFVALLAFVLLLLLEHFGRRGNPVDSEDSPSPALFPIVMTIMIGIPSFLLGTALGISDIPEAVIILVAILAHKGSAGFALALAMMRSTMKFWQVLVAYIAFACATPLGIVLGDQLHLYLTGESANAVKAFVLSLAAGVFLFMGTLHEQKHSPLIINCCTPGGFAVMMFGLLITAFVRWLLDLANHIH